MDRNISCCGVMCPECEYFGERHCGKCREFPCKRYDADDPTKSAEENELARKKQMELLASLK